MRAPRSDRTGRIGIGVATSAFESIDFAFREQSESDYGIDAHAELIESEQPTGRLVGIQLKSGPSYFLEPCSNGFVFRADHAHVTYWLNHALPVIVCLCDTASRNIYWQSITSETVKSTGKGYKLVVPTTNIVDFTSKPLLVDILTPIVAKEKYTIFRTDDSSHAGAKRYSFELVLNCNMSKAEIASIVRQATWTGRGRRYYRNESTEERWGDVDAHVVWTFVYPSADDHKRRNHICRSIWIDPNLEEAFRPLGFSGENIGDEVTVDWSSNYDFLSDFVSSNTLSKEDYFAEALSRIEELKMISVKLEPLLVQLSKNKIEESIFLTTTNSLRDRIDVIYSEISELKFAPFECRDMDIKLESFAAYLHNIWLFFSESGRTKWNLESRILQSLQQLSHAKNTLVHLEYEISKVR